MKDLEKVLQNGGIAVIPTDTIYGVVGRADLPATVARIYKIKNRAPEKQCIILIGDWSETKKFGVDSSKFKIPETDEPTSFILDGIAFRRPQKPEFQDFSPSLGRINAPQRGFVRLEQNLSESSSVNENNSDNGDPFKYNAIAGNKEQPKYMSYENQLTSNLMQVPEIEKFERKASWERTEIMFQNSPDAKSSSENTFEKYNPVKKFDQKEFQKEDILSRKEIKYSPTKP